MGGKKGVGEEGKGGERVRMGRGGWGEGGGRGRGGGGWGVLGLCAGSPEDWTPMAGLQASILNTS